MIAVRNFAKPSMWVLFTLSSLFMSAMSTAAHSAEPSNLDEIYSQISQLNGKTDVAKLKANVRKQAMSLKQTEMAVAKATLEDLKTVTPTSNGQREVAMAASSGNTPRLPAAKVGDIFWWDSATDHVGIYVGTKSVAHAPGPRKKTRIESIGSLVRKPKAEIMLVNTKSGGTTRIGANVRAEAKSFAEWKLKKPYNYDFVNNKIINDGIYNCSQYVWAAWMSAARIDLDNGISLGVYPGDIRKDKRTHTYKKLTK